MELVSEMGIEEGEVIPLATQLPTLARLASHIETLPTD